MRKTLAILYLAAALATAAMVAAAALLGLVMKEGAVLIALGTMVGMAGALAGIRLLSALLSTVSRAARAPAPPNRSC